MSLERDVEKIEHRLSTENMPDARIQNLRSEIEAKKAKIMTYKEAGFFSIYTNRGFPDSDDGAETETTPFLQEDQDSPSHGSKTASLQSNIPGSSLRKGNEVLKTKPVSPKKRPQNQLPTIRSDQSSKTQNAGLPRLQDPKTVDVESLLSIKSAGTYDARYESVETSVAPSKKHARKIVSSQ